MGKYDNYIKAFDDSRSHLDNFLLAEQLGEYNMPNSIKKCITNAIHGIDNGFNELIEMAVTDEVHTANLSLREEPYNMHCNCIFTEINYKRSLLVVNCFGKKFVFDKFNKSSYDKFMVEWAEMLEFAKNMSLLITHNLNQYKSIIEDAFTDLNKKFMATGNTSLKCSISTPGQPYTDIRVNITDGKINYDASISLTRAVKDWNIARKELFECFNYGFEYQTEKAKKDDIKKYVHKICDKYDIPRFEPNYRRGMPSFYNLKEGWVDISIPLNNYEVMRQFEFELRNAAIMIMELNHIIKDWQISGKISYNIGSKMFFILKDEKIIDGKTYVVYDSRVGNKKAILHVFCEGRILSGNERKRAIKLLGYGQQVKTPWPVHEYKYNSHVIPVHIRGRIVKHLNEKYNAGLV